MQRENELLIFAKAPRVGSVKTRLAATFGPDRACGIYKLLLKTLATRLRPIEPVTVCFTPDDGEADLRPFFPASWRYLPQRGTNLGKRLDLAIHHAFEHGAHKVAVIGSDSPDICPDDIAQAWRALDLNDVVFGPAQDGGYWLIGMNKPQPALFREIDWGTAKVLTESQTKARQSGLKIALLRSLTDIDTAADWAAYEATRSSSSK